MQWTSQQARIMSLVNHPEIQRAVVIAYAGTGKTSLLEGLSRMIPKTESILYLVFNKAAQKEAEARFPGHVTIKTVHGLAHSSVGARETTGQWTLTKMLETITKHCENEEHESWRMQKFDWKDARILRTFLEQFWHQGEEVDWGQWLIQQNPDDNYLKYCRIWGKILMETAWERSFDLGVPHDMYLKYYVHHHDPLPYQWIFLDEAQDSNGITLTLLETECHAHQVIVGDPNQAIYRFRDTVDITKRISRNKGYRLTRSFRFGPELAALATRILAWRSYQPPLIGKAPTTDIEIADTLPKARPITVIARYNATLWRIATNVVTDPSYNSDQLVFPRRQWRTVYDKMRAIATLYIEKKPVQIDGRSYYDYDKWKSHVLDYAPFENAWLIKSVEKHGTEIFSLLQKVQRRIVEVPDGSAIVFTTAHSAKGLEWDNVMIADDFPDLLDFTVKKCPVDDERSSNAQDELNLLYVAITRARRNLYIPTQMMKTLTPTWEFFVTNILDEYGQVLLTQSRLHPLKELSIRSERDPEGLKYDMQYIQRHWMAWSGQQPWPIRLAPEWDSKP